MESIGSRIASLREARGWSQEELAKRAGVSQSTIAAVEVDPRRKPRDLNKIAAALSVDPYDLEFGKQRDKVGGVSGDGSALSALMEKANRFSPGTQSLLDRIESDMAAGRAREEDVLLLTEMWALLVKRV